MAATVGEELLGGILQAFAGMRVEEYQAAAHAFPHQGRHPTLGRGFYAIPAERVIGSSNALEYQEDEHGGSVVYLARPDVFDDDPAPAAGGR